MRLQRVTIPTVTRDATAPIPVEIRKVRDIECKETDNLYMSILKLYGI